MSRNNTPPPPPPGTKLHAPSPVALEAKRWAELAVAYQRNRPLPERGTSPDNAAWDRADAEIDGDENCRDADDNHTWGWSER